MSKNEYHILNGDALKNQFPPDIEGKQIVLRECFVQGNVKGESLEELFKNRTDFFQESYGISHKGYHKKAMQELHKLLHIEEEMPINLWFENDLFCQVNFWFAINTLRQANHTQNIYLVSPIPDSWKGFGHLSTEELKASYANKKELSKEDLQWISNLWGAFQTSNWPALRKNAKNLAYKIDHIEAVVQAHIDRFPTTQSYGRPQERIRAIMQDLEEPNFPNVFKAFSETEGIYGFGDLQVKHIMEEMNL